jgi:hypothetical protein
MGKKYLDINDTISSKEGKAYITINGQNRELFEISSITAQLDMVTQSKAMLGHRMTQHKVVGAEGTGSMTMYFMNSDMLKIAMEYIKNGKLADIKLQIRNEDYQSSVGSQEIVLLGVILNTIPVTTLDDSSEDPITIDTDFSFDDIEGIDYFQLPSNFR